VRKGAHMPYASARDGMNHPCSLGGQGSALRCALNRKVVTKRSIEK
jgi:hypothetical protein